MLTLKGRFKGEVDERWHLVPISDSMHSGLPFRIGWNGCYIGGSICTTGSLAGSSRTGARLKFGQYDALFRALVDQAQERHPRLLPEAVETKNFSLWRSAKRGAVLETTNQDV